MDAVAKTKSQRVGTGLAAEQQVGERDDPTAHLEAEFNRLTAEWRAATEQSSDPMEILLHPACRKIIGLGPDILPLIFQELQRRPGLWFWALEELTGENPVPPQTEKLKQVRDAWLDFGRRRGYS
jgi:hypothetical protein